MMADHRGEEPQEGGERPRIGGAARLVRRLLRRISPARSGSSAGAIISGLVARPPGSLAGLDQLVGRRDVDRAGPEGHLGTHSGPFVMLFATADAEDVP